MTAVNDKLLRRMLANQRRQFATKPLGAVDALLYLFIDDHQVQFGQAAGQRRQQTIGGSVGQPIVVAEIETRAFLVAEMRLDERRRGPVARFT